MPAITPHKSTVSIVLPAKDEAESITRLLPQLRQASPSADIVLVDDGSTDTTAEVAIRLGARVISHPYCLGNGAAIKTGAKAANGDVIVFLDADGQHNPNDIPKLVALVDSGYDMAIGSRSSSSQANPARRLANQFYNVLASYVTGHTISDLTSGFRAARRDKFLEFLHLLPNGFSYPTTSTIAFFRAGYSVTFMPIEAKRRLGRSHIRPVQDGIRFLLILFRICTLYSPLKLFFPASLSFFSVGLGYYLYTYATSGRFTNMSALMLTTSILVFLIGLVSEQITQLIYMPRETPRSTATSTKTQYAAPAERATGT